MKAWLFQGQGSQRKGMGAALFARFPALVAEADAVLGYSIERLCLEDPEQQLNLTTFTQPAIYVVSWLGYLAAREDGVVASVAAGHSVGEYAALTAAGALDFSLGLRIVIERARLMAQVQGGGLVAVLGQDRQRVQALLDERPDAGLAIANINSPTQIIVGARWQPLNSCWSTAQRGDSGHCAEGERALPYRAHGRCGATVSGLSATHERSVSRTGIPGDRQRARAPAYPRRAGGGTVHTPDPPGAMAAGDRADAGRGRRGFCRDRPACDSGWDAQGYS